jgi:hypothetical protein
MQLTELYTLFNFYVPRIYRFLFVRVKRFLKTALATKK